MAQHGGNGDNDNGGAAAPANAAILYAPADYEAKGQIKGRHAAGEAFLKAFARHSGVDPFYAYCRTRGDAERFAREVAAHTGGRTSCVHVHFDRIERAAEPGTLFRPDPLIASLAWQRRHGDQRGFSICGVTHTTSSEGAMEGLAELMTAPVQPWDAVICTSDAVRSMVRIQLEAQAEYLKARFGVRPAIPCQTPVIPLGVHCDDYAPSPARQAAGRELRRKLGIAEDDVAGLFLGRLSFHAKANPFPMYRALQAAAERTGKRLHLIQAGWFANDWIERSFKEAAGALAPDVACHFLDGGDPDVRADVWHAADLFLSFSDNIQETYGLTPLEAMAAGLPVVVTDWNGYRQTVRPAVDGLTVPTWQPAPGAGAGLARRFAARAINYDNYVGLASQSVAVDLAAAAEAVTRLVEDVELRRRLGAAGAKRARQDFDWSTIVGRYQELWSELAARRAAEAESAPRALAEREPHAARGDPYRLFAGYPSFRIDAETRVTLIAENAGATLEQLDRLAIAEFGADMRLAADARAELIARLSEGSQTLAALLSARDPSQRERTVATVAWLAKYGVVTLSEGDS